MEVCGTQRIRAHLLWQLNVLLIICPLLILAEERERKLGMQCSVIDGKILTRSCYNPKVIMQENFCYFVLHRQYALLFKTFTSTKSKLRSFTFNL